MFTLFLLSVCCAILKVFGNGCAKNSFLLKADRWIMWTRRRLIKSLFPFARGRGVGGGSGRQGCCCTAGSFTNQAAYSGGISASYSANGFSNTILPPAQHHLHSKLLPCRTALPVLQHSHIPTCNCPLSSMVQQEEQLLWSCLRVVSATCVSKSASSTSSSLPPCASKQEPEHAPRHLRPARQVAP